MPELMSSADKPTGKILVVKSEGVVLTGEERTRSEVISSVSELSALPSEFSPGEFSMMGKMPEFTSIGKILTMLSTIGTTGSGKITSAGNLMLRLFGAAPEFCFSAGMGAVIFVSVGRSGAAPEICFTAGAGLDVSGVLQAMPEFMSLAEKTGVSLEVSLAGAGPEVFEETTRSLLKVVSEAMPEFMSLALATKVSVLEEKRLSFLEGTLESD